MTERELERWIQKKTGESPQEIRQLVNEVINFIYGRDCRQFLYVDKDNEGLPPFLVTEKGKYKYEFPAGSYPLNVRRTHKILTRGSNSYYRSQSWDMYRFQNIEFFDVPVGDQRDAWETTPAFITFDFDPGDTTEEFYHLFYFQPTTITSDAIEIPLPPNYHLQLRRAVLALVQEEEYGADIWKYVEDQLASRIWYEANRGVDSSDHRIPIRPEYRQYPYGEYFTTGKGYISR